MTTPPRAGADADFDAALRSALNPAQLEAATAGAGPHLLIAGAGSGKTRTLVYRVAHLVRQGVAPESILLLTFTRRASREMLRRASSLLDERCRRVAGGTYHSFANQVLRRYAERLEFDSRFTILDRSDAVDLMGLLRSEAGHGQSGRRFPRAEAIVNLLSKHVNTQRPVKDLLEQEYPQFTDDLDALLDLAGRFRRRKQQQNVMDYDDLLVYLRDLLAGHADVRQTLAGRYRYVMVDEYQDTNRLQAHVSALLASAHQNILVVGDDAQSIYSFRGANFRNIIDFPKIFPGCRQTLLEQNYRSTQPILDLGNAILETAREKFSKKLFSNIQGEQKPVFMRTPTDLDQAELVARRVLELREEGVPLGQIAVLARAAWHSNNLELELAERNIPFRKYGGIRFVESAHVKDVCALLRLAINPVDTAAWFRVLQLFEGVGPKTARKLIDLVAARDGDPRALVQPKLRVKAYGENLENLAQLLGQLGDAKLSVAARLDLAVERYEPWMRKKYDDAAQRLADFDSLAVLAERQHDLEGFLSNLAIDPPDFSRMAQPGDDGEDEYLTVSTIHSAKGLEWHTVFLLHLNAGRFPNWGSLQKPDEYEEERRLLYVAVTRAKHNLYLMKPEEISTRSRSFEVGEISPLLTDIRSFDQLVDERSYSPRSANLDMDAGEVGDDLEQLDRIQSYFSDP